MKKSFANRRKVIGRSLLYLCVAALWAGPGMAQSPLKGAITGSVQEEGRREAPIEGAVVTIANQETGFTANFRTQRDGIYLFELISPGLYRITVKADGYDAIPNSLIENFQVVFNLRSVVTPPPLELRKRGAPAPPAPAPAPVVGASQPSPYIQLVNLENATRSANFDERTILALPLSGNRTFDQLAFLTAGAAPPPQALGDVVGPGVGAGVGTSGQFSVNGLRSRANNFTVDGADNNDEDIGVRRQGFTALVPQSIESLQGYHIATLLPNSQFGRNLGAQVNAISRGGGQQLHGSLYGFFTDRRLKARDAFDLMGGSDDVLRRANGQPIVLVGAAERSQIPLPNPVGGEAPFTRGQYGFVLGGPATKERTFFFVAFERRDVNATREANFAVPTVAERGLFGSGETGLVLQVNGSPAPAFAVSPTGDAYFSLFPFANNPSGPYGRNTYTEQLPASADGSIFSGKLDRQLLLGGKEHSLTGRYNFADDATTLPVTGEAIFSTLRARVRAQNLSLFFVSPLASRISNELRVSYGRTRLRFDEVRNSFLQSSRLRDVPFLLNARKLASGAFPGRVETTYQSRGTDTETDTDPLGQVIVSGFSPIGADVNNFPQRRVNNTFQFADTAFFTEGRHRIIGGADFRRTQLNSQVDRNFRPVVYFSGSVDIAPAANRLSASNGFFQGADFVSVGAATGFLQTLAVVPDSTIGLRLWQGNIFALDQIGLRPNFKLTLGARYEVNTVPEEVDRRIEATFTSSETQRFIAEERARFQASGLERYLAGRASIYRRDLDNIAPHIAFAWDPTKRGRIAIRAGYGIYYDQIPGAVISQSRSVFPRFMTINLAGVQVGQEVIAFNPARLARSGTLNTFDATRGLGRDLFELLTTLARLATPRPNHFPGTPGFVLPVADLATPYSQHWGVTVEREVARQLLVSAAYVGTKGTHLLRLTTPNLGINAIPLIDGGSLFGQTVLFRGGVASPGVNFRRPDPLLGAFTSIESGGNSSYHSLQAEASLRPTKGIQLTAAYVWSHAIDEVSDLFELAGARGLPQNSFNLAAERGSANFDVRHRFVSSFIWELPVFSGHKHLGGWQLAGIAALQTGQPYTVGSSIDVNLDGNLTDRLQMLTGIQQVDEGALQYRFPATAVEQFRLLANAGADGAIGRNTFRAPGIASLDLALNKRFLLTERQQVELRAEMFNAFNRSHFGMPVHTLFFPGLGRAVNTTVPARTVQFAVRYKF